MYVNADKKSLNADVEAGGPLFLPVAYYRLHDNGDIMISTHTKLIPGQIHINLSQN